jgi:hypothetical protein
MIMVAMWMLSGSTSESGAHDMMAAILLRGLGLGFLFLSIPLIAFSDLNDRNRASGIGLFAPRPCWSLSRSDSPDTRKCALRSHPGLRSHSMRHGGWTAQQH